MSCGLSRYVANFYPRSPCGERPCTGDCPAAWRHRHFYPRSPCGERPVCQLQRRTGKYFYPRSPCGERHLRVVDGSQSSIISIHALLAESDAAFCQVVSPKLYFYPRSPCGERHLRVLDGSKSSIISIHALLAESDGGDVWACRWPDISIHALLAESDSSSAGRESDTEENFYPRSPCGERPPFAR